MQVTPIKTALFKTNDSLFEFIKTHLSELQTGDVLVVTSKIISLAEGRVGKLVDKEKIIREESVEIIETPWADLTLTSRGWEINAGVDESNADNQLILLPEDTFASAQILLEKLKTYYKISKLGIVITDTRSTPLRVGTIGRAIGWAGFLSNKSYIGKEDLYGRQSRLTTSNTVDALASTAVLVMGEGNEQTPLAIINDAPVNFVNEVLAEEEKKIYLSPAEDIFSYVYRKKGR